MDAQESEERRGERENPYVGPRSFQEDEQDRFFGRENEARDLLAQVLIDRLVVFYAQSGAGKTSLTNARLIPGLRAQGFDILPVGRVPGAVPEGIVPTNLFTFNLISRLSAEHPDLPSRLNLLHELAQLTLPAYFGASPPTDDAPHAVGYESVPTALIIDQFEEIFTADVEDERAITGFFQRLRDAQTALPGLWVVLAMREEFIAQLDTVAHLMPNRLRHRFYMQRLSYTAAMQAISGPAQAAGRPFTEDAARVLVDELRAVRVQDRGSTTRTILGRYVEPVQLQVVCLGLWEHLTDDAREITVGDVEQFGNVDRALSEFYDSALDTTAAETSIAVARLRSWVKENLITSGGTRGLVYRGEHTTENLPNAAVDVLERARLIRSEPRRRHLIELTHDRLIEPILASNTAFNAVRVQRRRHAQRVTSAIATIAVLLAIGFLIFWSQRVAATAQKAQAEAEQAQAEAEQAQAEAQTSLSTITVRYNEHGRASLLPPLNATASWGTALPETPTATEQSAVLGTSTLVLTETPPGATATPLRTGTSPPLTPTLASVHITGCDLLAIPDAYPPPDVHARTHSYAHTGPDLAVGLRRRGIEHGRVLGRLQPKQRRSCARRHGWRGRHGADLGKSEQRYRIHVPEPRHGRGVHRLIPPGWRSRGCRRRRHAGRDLGHRRPRGTGETARPHQRRHGLDVQPEWRDGGHRQLRLHGHRLEMQLRALVRRLAEHSDVVSSVAFNPFPYFPVRPLLATGSWDGTARVWDVATGTSERFPRGQEPGPGGKVWSVVFSRDGQSILTGSDDGVIRWWDRKSGTFEEWKGHTAGVTSLTFSRDGGTLISTSGDSTVRVWDVATKTSQVLTLGQVLYWSAASVDNRHILTVDSMGNLRVWEGVPAQP